MAPYSEFAEPVVCVPVFWQLVMVTAAPFCVIMAMPPHLLLASEVMLRLFVQLSITVPLVV